jgi:hypothetical protein
MESLQAYSKATLELRVPPYKQVCQGEGDEPDAAGILKTAEGARLETPRP